MWLVAKWDRLRNNLEFTNNKPTHSGHIFVSHQVVINPRNEITHVSASMHCVPKAEQIRHLFGKN